MALLGPYDLPASVQAQSVSARPLGTGDRVLRSAEIIKIYSLEFLQIMFSKHHRRVWKPDEAETGILIVDKYSFNLETVAARPAIVANRGPMRWGETSGFRQMQTRDQMSDRRTYTDLVEGSVTFSCFARGAEAEDIAYDVFEWFKHFQDAIRERGSFSSSLDRVGMFRVSSVSIGEEALVKSDSAPDLSVVPVQIRAMVQQRWMMIPSAVKLKEIMFTFTRNGSPV